MQFWRRLVRALRGGLVGLLPGSVACILYSSIRLAVQGDLAFLAYETYVLPTLVLIGGVIGALVGSVVGWAGGSPVALAGGWSRKVRGAAVWRLLGTGAPAGMVIVSLAAVVLWATQDGRADAGFLVEVNCAGAFVGSVVALSVGFGLPYLEWAIDHAGQKVVAGRPRE